MKINDRVNHNEYGDGTIIHMMFEGTPREIFLVKFDISNGELHNGFGASSINDCLWCTEKELKIIC